MRGLSTLCLSLCVGMLPCVSFGQAELTTKSTDSVAVVAGQPISEQELVQALGPQILRLRQQEYELKSKALDSLIRQRLIEAEASKRGIPVTKLLEQDVDSKVAEVTDSEIESYFWGQNRTGVRFEDVKGQLQRNLRQIRIQRARDAYADSLRMTAEVATMLRAPSVDVAYDPARLKGDPDAPVTIVEFSDFQCPFCNRTRPILENLLAKYKGRVKLAYLDFPLSQIHARAVRAAEASHCAAEQGAFWEYHDALFAKQSELDDVSLFEHAHNLKLNERAFQSCLTSGRPGAAVQADLQQGNKLGIGGTPAYFINGTFLSGAQPQAEFEKIIDRELSILRVK